MRHLAIAFAMIIAPAPAVAAPLAHAGATVVVENGGPTLFAAGSDVTLSGAFQAPRGFAPGVFAAGSRVEASATFRSPVTLAGAEVRFSGAADRIRLVGADVRFEGRADRSVMLAGAGVAMSDAARVGGALRAAGADIRIEGEIDGSVLLDGGKVVFNGRAGGDVVVDAETVTIGPNAVIAGALRFHSPADATVSPSASVTGGVTRLALPPRIGSTDGALTAGDIADRALVALVVFAAMAASGALMMLMFPAWFGAAAAAARDQPIATLVAGVGLATAAPLAALLLTVSGLGLPAGVFFLALLGSLLAVSVIGGGLAVGHFAVDRTKDVRARPTAFLTGLAVVMIFSIAPLVGAIVVLAAAVFGLGALGRGLWLALRA